MTSQWARWRLKSPASRLFTQPFIHTQIKKNQSSASLAFVRGIHRWPVNSPHKGPVTRKMFPFDDVIMLLVLYQWQRIRNIERASMSLRPSNDFNAHGSHLCMQINFWYKLYLSSDYTMFLPIEMCFTIHPTTLQWRHNGCDSVLNHQPRECLLSRLIRRRSKKTSKLRITGLYAGNSPETGEFPAQRASNAENVSISTSSWNVRHTFDAGRLLCYYNHILSYITRCTLWRARGFLVIFTSLATRKIHHCRCLILMFTERVYIRTLHETHIC